MGMIKFTNKSSWWLRSESDTRWNANGNCMYGGFVMPNEVKNQIENFKLKYGDYPKDLEWGCMKH